MCLCNVFFMLLDMVNGPFSRLHAKFLDEVRGSEWLTVKSHVFWSDDLKSQYTCAPTQPFRSWSSLTNITSHYLDLWTRKWQRIPWYFENWDPHRELQFSVLVNDGDCILDWTWFLITNIWSSTKMFPKEHYSLGQYMYDIARIMSKWLWDRDM